MLQEAVYLACTALGLGSCIHNLGINGTEYENKIMTTKHLILEIHNSCGTQKFSTVSPGSERSFRKGKNLSEPKRDGDADCLKTMKQLTLESTGLQDRSFVPKFVCEVSYASGFTWLVGGDDDLSCKKY